ncbi:MAG: dihydropteroate synthase [Thermoplasmata archaeon]
MLDNVYVIELEDDEIKEEMKKIGVANEGIEIMHSKSKFYLLKIEKVPLKDAIILKQEALSLGMDCALSWNVVSLKTEYSDALLFGTLKQFDFLAKKMYIQPFHGREISELINESIYNYNLKFKKWKMKDKSIEIKNVKVMGILNITPDSFYDGGKYFEKENAIKRIKEMVDEGADIIDIGAESSRPGSKSIDADTEINRLKNVIDDAVSTGIPISVDTYKSKVAEFVLEHGAQIINDIYGLRKEGMAEIIKRYSAGIIIMHMKGNPENMQENPTYNDVLSETLSFLKERIRYAINEGIKIDQISVDPGIGFGKNLEHNIAILKHLEIYKSLGVPITLGLSRKSFLGKLTGLNVEERLIPSIASAMFAVFKGVDILRVHDVKETKIALKVIEGIMK